MKPKLVAAFTAVYLIWGSTYLAIKFAIETIPPFLLGAVRFLAAGSILYVWARWDGARPESSHAWKRALLMGFLLLFMGNGSVAVVEQWAPSGLVALVISSTPLWIALLEWFRPGGKRPGIQVAAGLVLGFIGVTFLIDLGNIRNGTAIDPMGAAILTAGTVSWAIGSLYAREVRLSSSPIMTSAMQMLCGGFWLMIGGLATGELSRLSMQTVSLNSILACLYLMFFGSIVAFTSFSWLLKNAAPARAATYAYVNPCVAVFLGWLIAGEPLTGRVLFAMAVIVTAVIVITSAKVGQHA